MTTDLHIYSKEELFNLKPCLPDTETERKVQKIWDMVAKPLSGLGIFEELFVQIGGITGKADFNLDKKGIIVMCADNGIVESGVSQSGQEVTAIVAKCMGQNQSSVGKMCAVAKADVIPVDIGMNTDEQFDGVLPRKVAKGTKNFLYEDAMTLNQVLEAISIGIDMVRKCHEEGYSILGTGEMGIGNTTTSSAMAAAFLKCKASEVTGKGAGLTDEGLRNKINIIEEALRKKSLGKYSKINSMSIDGDILDEKFQKEETLKILSAVGGLDIAGLCGVFIGGALYGIPVVVDGLISLVAAVTAERLLPGCKKYIIGSHCGKEPAINILNKEIGIKPVINANLALGEGTGVAMFFPLLDVAMAVYKSSSTFDNISLEQYQRY